MLQAVSEAVKSKLHRVSSHSQQSRLELCGRALPRMKRNNGEIISGASYWCRLKQCQRCARKRAQTVYACCEARVDESAADADACRMVTLTVRLPDGLSLDRLRSNVNIIARIQRDTHQMLRDQAHAHKRIGAPDARKDWRYEARTRIPRARPIVEDDGSVTYHDKTFDEATGYRPPSLGSVTYIWHREITTGEKGNRWHVHLHYLVPSYADAETLIGAWDACSGQKDVTRCKISEPQTSTRDGVQSAAAYITHYITNDEWQEMPEFLLRTYLQGTHGRRGYDAAGEWRPLGIGPDETSPQERVVAVERKQWVYDATTGEVDTRARWDEASAFFQWGECWKQWRDRPMAAVPDLNQLRTMLSSRRARLERLFLDDIDVPWSVWHSAFPPD